VRIQQLFVCLCMPNAVTTTSLSIEGETSIITLMTSEVPIATVWGVIPIKVNSSVLLPEGTLIEYRPWESEIVPTIVPGTRIFTPVTVHRLLQINNTCYGTFLS